MIYNRRRMRPWLNWIEQQISNLWVAGSSPAGRARSQTGNTLVLFMQQALWTRIDQVAKQR